MCKSLFVWISSAELYFEVRLNVSLTGDHNPEYILGTWVSLTQLFAAIFGYDLNSRWSGKINF